MEEIMLHDGFHKLILIETELKGKRVFRERLILKSAVAGCVVDEKGKIAIVTQYRPAADFLSKEIPAGLLDKEGLTPIEILIEELLEECEVPKEDLLSIDSTPFHEYFIVIGSSNAKLFLHDVRVKEQTNKQVSDADVESVEWVELATLKDYIDKGLVQDPKTLLTYHYLLEKERKA